MSSSLYEPIRETIKFVVNYLIEFALPLAIVVGAGIVAYAVKGSVLGRDDKDLTKTFGQVFAYVVAGLFIVCGWTGLSGLSTAAWEDIYWQHEKFATEEPVLKAPPIEQVGPVVASLVDKTYSRTLTLPPEFFQRIGAEGVGVLSPYLVDPTAENVKTMVDSFRRSGEDVVFSRELTRTDESPMPFNSAGVDVKFKRIGERAYNADFRAEYQFENETGAQIEGRFLFYPPQNGGTIQSLSVEVDGDSVKEPDRDGRYIWIGQMQPGEVKTATVHYSSVGTDSWFYELGSQRRRVRDFRLTASIDGPVEYQQGTISPSHRDDHVIEWELDDVLTSQRIGLVFPEDVAARDAFIDALGNLPVAMVLMLVALIAVGLRTGLAVSPRRLALATVTVVIGLGSSYVLYQLLGYHASLALGATVAAVATAAVTQWRSMAVLLPLAMVPLSSMGQKRADVWLLILAILAVGLMVSPIYSKSRSKPDIS